MVQLVPEPLPALSTGSQDQELDVTLDEIATQETRSPQHDTDQDAGGTEQETSAQGEEKHHIHIKPECICLLRVVTRFIF